MLDALWTLQVQRGKEGKQLDTLLQGGPQNKAQNPGRSGF